jgi:ribonuclease HI
MIKCFTDGATKGWNGKLGTVSVVGIGVYCEEINVKYSQTLKGISNNEAEFLALIKGMEVMIEASVKEVTFYLDSQIVVNRANGKKPKLKKYQNDRMDKFQDRVLELAEQFKEVQFEWIPREENTEADSLSKKTLQVI